MIAKISGTSTRDEKKYLCAKQVERIKMNVICTSIEKFFSFRSLPGQSNMIESSENRKISIFEVSI